jgi:hypothetical protein
LFIDIGMVLAVGSGQSQTVTKRPDALRMTQFRLASTAPPLAENGRSFICVDRPLRSSQPVATQDPFLPTTDPADTKDLFATVDLLRLAGVA